MSVKWCKKSPASSLVPALIALFFFFHLSPYAGSAVPENFNLPHNVPSGFDNDLDLYDLESEEVQELYPFAEPPVLLESVTPIYPELSKQAEIEGTIMLRGVIGENGRVVEVSVIESDANAAMERAAMAAAIQFRFRPAKQRSVPVKVQVAIPFSYRLR